MEDRGAWAVSLQSVAGRLATPWGHMKKEEGLPHHGPCPNTVIGRVAAMGGVSLDPSESKLAAGNWELGIGSWELATRSTGLGIR